MTISYKWLCDYLPEEIEPQQLSIILTSVGLEVESLTFYESIRGSLSGVVIGEVLECVQHPNADKLKLTRVDIGSGEPLKIVCGAPNVATGQKVLVATIGTTLYPSQGDPITMKAAKIRGEESQGMICAEDELGLGSSHAGIMILPSDVVPGTPAAEYLHPYTDWIYEIGLTPNRMDAMSHLGVAKDVCAYLSHHNGKNLQPKTPFTNEISIDTGLLPIKVLVENTEACRRYSGVSISNIEVKESPKWLQDRLMAIGQRPINNIVDITNYILHETGQPLHAFDAEAIKQQTILVKTLPQDTVFLTLDEKERKLDKEDLMICNGESEGMCIAGVFGGAKSGVGATTRNIFLESAWFNPRSIRRTSFRHGLRTEAATRFEKGVDISNTANVLKRAALLIKQVAGGVISSEIIDVYPNPADKVQVTMTYNYLRKLSGKSYTPSAVKQILISLGFEIILDDLQQLTVAVPFNKPDISLPADIVEEIVRIDGLDNIEIPAAITITPSSDSNILKESLKRKVSGFLTGLGFNEIVTNSITNSQYYTEEQQSSAVRMINSLSSELDVMRSSMIETGLEALAYNINRKNSDLGFFEYGKTYDTSGVGKYNERENLTLYVTGSKAASWRNKAVHVDFYYLKGLVQSMVELIGTQRYSFSSVEREHLNGGLQLETNKKPLAVLGEVSGKRLKHFDIKQPVYYAEFDLSYMLRLNSTKKIEYKEVPKFQAVNRDLALVIDKSVNYDALEKAVEKAKIARLQEVRLFDVFESEKLGAGKKSLAVSFTFLDEEKTLTDKEVDGMMNKLIGTFENELKAEIRK